MHSTKTLPGFFFKFLSCARQHCVVCAAPFPSCAAEVHPEPPVVSLSQLHRTPSGNSDTHLQTNLPSTDVVPRPSLQAWTLQLGRRQREPVGAGFLKPSFFFTFPLSRLSGYLGLTPSRKPVKGGGCQVTETIFFGLLPAPSRLRAVE